MFEAEVGDDVYGEDPTVNLLERRAAEIAGNEAALFVPTGTMGNTIAIKLLHRARPGGDLRFARPHSRLRAVHDRLVLRLPGPHRPPPRTAFSAGTQIRAPFGRSPAIARPPALMEIENTHNMAGGTRLPAGRDPRNLRRRARARPARCTWTARVSSTPPHATGVSGDARSRLRVDTVMFCLSKALGAPVGLHARRTGRPIAKAASTANGSAAACARPACWPPPA